MNFEQISVNRAHRLATLLLIFFSDIPLFSQDYNPHWPRTVFQRPRGDTGGTTDQAFARFDWAANSGIGNKGANLALRTKAINPQIVYLGTAKPQGFWPDSDPAEFHLTKGDHYAILLQDTQGGESEIYVSTTDGFPSEGDDRYAFIGSDIFEYRSVVTDSFIGIDTAAGNLRIEAHSIGDTITMPIRRSGTGMLPNFSPYAPEVDGKKSWQYFVDKRFDRTDFSVFDGIFYDAFDVRLWRNMFNDIDFDRNHVNDWVEHGGNWIQQTWAEGIDSMLTYERERYEQLHPNQPSIIAVNAGVAQGDDSVEEYLFDLLNGMKWEGFFRYAYDWQTIKRVNQLWEQRGRQPVMMMIEDYVKEKNADDGKNDYAYMRYGLTTALVTGAYYGRTFGDYYYIYLYYDEFDTDLGYPTSGPLQMDNGCYARFFDRGVAICNPTGSWQPVYDDDLRGFSEYHGPYWRFRGGQDPSVNNGSMFDSVLLYGATASRPKDNRGDGIVLFNAPDTVLCPILVGNCNNNDTSPGSSPLQAFGDWNTVQAGYDSLVRNPYYSHWHLDEEGRAHFTAPAGDGSSYAKWTPTIGLAGYYDIAEWHGWKGNYETSVTEATNAPFEVIAGDSRVLSGTIDFSVKAGQWNRLGIAYLPEGTSSYVIVTNKADGPIIADCMKFEYLGQNVSWDVVPPQQINRVKINR